MFDDSGSFLLAVFEFFLLLAWLACLIWIVNDIFRSADLGGVGKALWLILVIVLPWLGVIVYLISRGGGMHERELAQMRARRPVQVSYANQVSGERGDMSGPSTAEASMLAAGGLTPEQFDALESRSQSD
jgi:Phospholipase_D-nuclease N-terminal